MATLPFVNVYIYVSAKYTYQSSNLTSQDEFGAEVLLWLGFALSLGLALLQWLLATFFYIAVKLLTSKHF